MENEIEYYINELSKTKEGRGVLKKSAEALEKFGFDKTLEKMSEAPNVVEGEKLPSNVPFRVAQNEQN